MKHIIDVLTMHKDTDSRLTKEIKQKIKHDIIKRYDDDSNYWTKLPFLIQGSRNVCLTVMIRLR